MPLGAARVSHDEDEVVRLDAAGGDLQPALRLVRHVALVVGGRLAVLADVRAQVAPVARVARPAPVVGFAAEHADALGRRVHEADVLDFELPDLEVTAALEKRGDVAAGAVFLARRDALLHAAVNRVVPLAIGRRRGDGADDAGGDVDDRRRHEDAGAGAVRQFVGQRWREEPVLQQVALRARIELQAAGHAMMVRDDQAVGRYEGRRAAAERHDGAHRLAGEVGERLRVTREPEGPKLRSERGNLLGHPHALLGDHAGRQQHDESERDDARRFHDGCLLERPRQCRTFATCWDDPGTQGG